MEFSEGMEGPRLNREGYDYIRGAVPRMQLCLPWLVAIVDEMKDEDPWQEGPYALRIALEWEKSL